MDIKVLERRVNKIISDHLKVDPEKLASSASFIDDLGADSLDIVELMMSLESELDFTISDDDASDIQTVGDLVRVFKRHC